MSIYFAWENLTNPIGSYDKRQLQTLVRGKMQILNNQFWILYVSGLLLLATALHDVGGDDVDDDNIDNPPDEEEVDTEYEELFDFAPGELDCPPDNTKWMQNDEIIAWGVPDRALRTLPSYLYIDKSLYPKAGLGIFTKTFIPKYSWLAEYEGEIMTNAQENLISWYAWSIHRDGELMYYQDAGNPETSTYVRYVNTANRESHENVMVAECRGRIYYLTCKDIAPGAELLVNYGDEYLDALGINVKQYYDVTGGT